MKRRDIQNPHVPGANPRVDTVLSPAGQKMWKLRRNGFQNTFEFKPGKETPGLLLTSVPQPGRKFLTDMVLPGAGKGASIMPLMKGCTKAGEMALLFSTSSRIWRISIHSGLCILVILTLGYLGCQWTSFLNNKKPNLVKSHRIGAHKTTRINTI